MPSIIQADQLKSADGVTTYLNSGTLSNVTFPSGTLIKATVKKDTSGHEDQSGSTAKAAKTYTSITCTVGNTIVFSWDFKLYAGALSGSATDRTAHVFCYQHISSVTEGATSGHGTKLNTYRVGRNLASGSGSSATSFAPVHIQASFVATATTHHLGLVFYSGGSDIQARVHADSDYPLLLTAYEFQGDVLT